MSFNRSPFAFGDLRDLFQKAMETPKGLRIIQENRGRAIRLSMRLNYLRKMNRKENALTFPVDHPLHMRSEWDKLEISVPKKGTPDEHCVYIRHRKMEDLKIEELE